MLNIKFGSAFTTKREIILGAIWRAVLLSLLFPTFFFLISFDFNSLSFKVDLANKANLFFLGCFLLIGIFIFIGILYFFPRNHLYKRYIFDEKSMKIFFKGSVVREIGYEEIKWFWIINGKIGFRFESVNPFKDVGMGDLTVADLDAVRSFLLSKNIRQGANFLG